MKKNLKWCYDRFTDQIVFFEETDRFLMEIGHIDNFTETDYKRLPDDNLDCLQYLIEKWRKNERHTT